MSPTTTLLTLPLGSSEVVRLALRSRALDTTTVEVMPCISTSLDIGEDASTDITSSSPNTSEISRSPSMNSPGSVVGTTSVNTPRSPPTSVSS